MFKTENDHLNLLAILEAIEKIEKITCSIPSAEEFEKDFISFDATLMNFIVIGEMTLRLSPVFMDHHNQVQWFKLRAFRNFVAHNYFRIDAEKVWEIIQTKLPDIKIKITKMMND